MSRAAATILSHFALMHNWKFTEDVNSEILNSPLDKDILFWVSAIQVLKQFDERGELIQGVSNIFQTSFSKASKSFFFPKSRTKKHNKPLVNEVLRKSDRKV